MTKNSTQRERIEKVIRKLNPIDDLMFRKLAESREFCEEILREFLKDPHLQVIENQSQYSITSIEGRSVVLDAYCVLKDGKSTNVEVQNLDNTNHQKRVRYYSSVLTTSLMKKGESFENLPEVSMVYICNFDIFNKNQILYSVKRVIDGTDIELDNGFEEIYISANINDGSSLSELMEVFTKDESYSEKFPVISEMKYRFKHMDGGVKMTEAMKELYEEIDKIKEEVREESRKEGREEGREEGKIITLISLVKDGIISLVEAAKRSNMSVENFEEYLKQ